MESGKEAYLLSKILDLDEKLTHYERILHEFQVQRKNLEAKIESLGNAPGGDANALHETKKQLLDLIRDFSIAEYGQPLVKTELEKLKGELDKMRGNKTHNLGGEKTMEKHSYFDAVPDSDGDQARTAEIKRYSQEPQSGYSGEADRREAAMDKASREIERRTKKAMLYCNLDYFTASSRVVQADPELASLWSHGYVKD